MDKKGNKCLETACLPLFSPEPLQNRGKHLALQRLQIAFSGNFPPNAALSLCLSACSQIWTNKIPEE